MSMSFVSVNNIATSSSLKNRKQFIVAGLLLRKAKYLTFFTCSGRYSLRLREWDFALQKRVKFLKFFIREELTPKIMLADITEYIYGKS